MEGPLRPELGFFVLPTHAGLAAPPPVLVSDEAGGGWCGWCCGTGCHRTLRTRLNTTLHALEDDLQVEVAVVTVDDVAGSPREFAMNLGNHWGLGDAQTNNGLVVLLVVGKRRLEMQTGYGLEKALDEGWLTQMQEAHMVPAFKRGDFGAGLVAGIGQVDRRLRRDPDATREGARAPASGLDQDPASSSPRWPAVPLEVAVLGVGGATGGGLLLSVLGLRHRRRQRTCPMCGVYMPMLDEVSDDAHLSEGQRTEEEIRLMEVAMLNALEFRLSSPTPWRLQDIDFGALHLKRYG